MAPPANAAARAASPRNATNSHTPPPGKCDIRSLGGGGSGIGDVTPFFVLPVMAFSDGGGDIRRWKRRHHGDFIGGDTERRPSSLLAVAPLSSQCLGLSNVNAITIK